MGVILGIDPGQKGALVWLDGWRVVHSALMPAQPKVGLLTADLVAELRRWRPDRVVLERAQSMPKQGISSAFKYGRDFGRIEGVLITLGIPFVTVSPVVWHRALCGAKPKGEDSSQAKARAQAVVQERLPGLDLTPGRLRVPNEGLIDAAAIALYGVQTLGST
jgi:hypothetical protein